MSTATWKIGPEEAEVIAREDDRKRWNLDRAWPSNWALQSANQYDWAAFASETEVICWRCAVQNVINGEVPDAELFTYEDSEEMLCGQCEEIWLGGFSVECECCEKWVWSTPTIHPETNLWGRHTPYSEGGGAIKLYPDGAEDQDDRHYYYDENTPARWVCYDCIDKHYKWSAETFTYTRKGN